jgi:mannose/fructose/N-acetylgalactosamine-specific phosphotransferase system component IIC
MTSVCHWVGWQDAHLWATVATTATIFAAIGFGLLLKVMIGKNQMFDDRKQK